MKNDCVIYENEIKLLTHSVSSNHISYDAIILVVIKHNLDPNIKLD